MERDCSGLTELRQGMDEGGFEMLGNTVHWASIDRDLAWSSPIYHIHFNKFLLLLLRILLLLRFLRLLLLRLLLRLLLLRLLLLRLLLLPLLQRFEGLWNHLLHGDLDAGQAKEATRENGNKLASGSDCRRSEL